MRASPSIVSAHITSVHDVRYLCPFAAACFAVLTAACAVLCTDNVELEIVLPGSMTVAESHDLALALQHKIELLDDVERAFVHVDHQLRDGLEHKVERELHLLKASKAANGGGHLSRVYNQLRSRFQRRRRSEEGRSEAGL